MREGSVYLKVKIKSLVEETKIIRKEQARTRRKERDLEKRQFLCHQLARHRQDFNKGEMRSTLLAYAFLRGRAYARIEPYCSKGPDWDRIKALIKKYGPLDYGKQPWSYSAEGKAYLAELEKDMEAWIQAGQDHISATCGNEGRSRAEAELRMADIQRAKDAERAKIQAAPEAGPTVVPEPAKEEPEKRKKFLGFL